MRATTATQGFEKLRTQKEQGYPVQGCVLDITFPEKPLEELLKEGVEKVVGSAAQSLWQGAELYTKIRSEFPAMKIMIFSVHSEEEIKAKFPKVQFDCPFFRKAQAHPLEVYKAMKQLVS